MRYLLIVPFLFLVACGKQGTSKLHKIESQALAKFVNEKNLPKDPNLTLDKSIVNNNYPIEIALYSDNRFYYNLPNLGDGRGTWEFSEGKIELRAKRTLFDMYIEIMGTDEAAQNLSIHFIDRFGPNTLNMMNVNI